MTSERTVIVGGPRTGKTTLAATLDPSAMHTDDLIGVLPWSAASQHIADDWISKPGPWTIEGVAAVRALRKWLAANEGKPCERVIVLEVPRVELTTAQAGMAKGHAKILAEIEGELASRGVEIVR